VLNLFLDEPDFKIRQTVINAAGEIGKSDFNIAEDFFDTSLLDTHHSVRNAVVGSIKKMGEKNICTTKTKKFATHRAQRPHTSAGYFAHAQRIGI
jgi:hypothetical protein